MGPTKGSGRVGVFLVGSQRFFGFALRDLGASWVDVGRSFGNIAQDRAVIVRYLHEAAVHGEGVDRRSVDVVDASLGDREHANERDVTGQKADLTFGRTHDDLFGLGLEDDAFGRDELDMNGHCGSLLLLECLGARSQLGCLALDVFGATDHVERLLWQVIHIAVDECLERIDGLFDTGEDALLAGEDLGHEHWL